MKKIFEEKQNVETKGDISKKREGILKEKKCGDEIKINRS